MMVDEEKRTEGSGKRRLLQVDGALGQSLAGPEGNPRCKVDLNPINMVRSLGFSRKRKRRLAGWEDGRSGGGVR